MFAGLRNRPGRHSRASLDHRPAHRPLLSGDEIAALQARLGALPPEPPALHSVAHRLLGEQPSPFRGQGFDYEESRPYQAGDEPRFMNWRATARRGQFVMKVFREERRPAVFLVIDRRQSMRFGTRVRLKAAQALRVAVLLAEAAARRQYPLGGLVLDGRPQWLPERPAPAAGRALVAAANGPCPPGGDPAEPPLGDILRQLAVSLTPGTRLCLISDLFDLDPACTPLLQELAARHALAACQIVDPGERALPPAGPLRVAGAGGGIRRLDSDDPGLRSGYREAAAAFLEGRRQAFRDLGLPCPCIPGDAEAIEQALFEEVSE